MSRRLASHQPGPAPPSLPRTILRGAALAALVLLTASACASPAAVPGGHSPPEPLRIGFSQRMFVDVNENDARAAMIVWARTMGRERDIPVELTSHFLRGPDAIRDALARGTVDAITLTADEYWALGDEAPRAPFIVGVIAGRVDEEYVLVVRKDRGFTSLAQLRGGMLGVYDNPRACLAPIWLETLLLQQGAPRVPDFFGRVTASSKLARVVLPVFFGQAEAGLVTHSGFELMCELNPQIGEQLTVLNRSAAVLPVVFCFRRDYASPYRAQLLAAVGSVHETPAGQQTLMLFQAERLIACSEEQLGSARRLLEAHRALTAHLTASPAPWDSVEPAPDAPPR